MLRDGSNYCDGCGQKLPPKAMLARQAMTAAEAVKYRTDASVNSDGTVTIDLCLACRIREANLRSGR
jgi:hypothetical protein